MIVSDILVQIINSHWVFETLNSPDIMYIIVFFFGFTSSMWYCNYPILNVMNAFFKGYFNVYSLKLVVYLLYLLSFDTENTIFLVSILYGSNILSFAIVHFLNYVRYVRNVLFVFPVQNDTSSMDRNVDKIVKLIEKIIKSVEKFLKTDVYVMELDDSDSSSSHTAGDEVSDGHETSSLSGVESESE